MYSLVNTRSTRFHLLLPLLAAAALMLTACNTIEGAGKDVEATGDAVSDAARKSKEAITD